MPINRAALLLCALIAAGSLSAPGTAQPVPGISPQAAEQRLGAVVRLRLTVPGDARTAESLGRERNGSGVVIDQSGLILTIGYLMVEAESAEVMFANGRTLPAQIVGYDHESGFGLLRTLEPPRVAPAPLGRSAGLKPQDPVMIAAHGGAGGARPAIVVSRRVFAGSWEYMLEDAIFTSPPHPAWSGAALFDNGGRLVGIGSLAVNDAAGQNFPIPGNMFVPIDRLSGILADLIADGAPAGPRRPWLGLSTEEARGRLFVARVTPESPAARAGLAPGDIVLGVDGAPVGDLADFYRKLWAAGDAGVRVRLTVLAGMTLREVTIETADRHAHLRLKRTF
jgi:S1-C subfamily serine protease